MTFHHQNNPPYIHKHKMYMLICNPHTGDRCVQIGHNCRQLKKRDNYYRREIRRTSASVTPQWLYGLNLPRLPVSGCTD